MNIKIIPVIAIGVVLMATPSVRAEDDSYQETQYNDYEDYEVFDDVEDLIDGELIGAEDIVEEVDDDIQNLAITEVPAPRAVVNRMSCDEINARVDELRTDVKSYPDLRADLEYMLLRQRDQCAPRAARRPVHNYRNVNPVVELEAQEVQAPEESVAPEKTKEIVKEVVITDTVSLAQIEENRANGLCDNGDKPNRYGCCDGEKFKEVSQMNFACCPKEGEGECVAPRKK